MTQKRDPGPLFFPSPPESTGSFKLPRSPFLYPILDSDFSKNLFQDAIQIVSAGVRILQIRAKNWTKKQLFHLISQLEPYCMERSVLLIVNDSVDIALLTQAAGVHLGQDDFPAAEARALLPSRVLGISTHNLEQFLSANQMQTDYIAVGPVYPTSTKQTANAPLGLDFVRNVSKIKRKPLVCIGGIRNENFRDLISAGADGIAVISELYAGKSIQDHVFHLLEMLS